MIRVSLKKVLDRVYSLKKFGPSLFFLILAIAEFYYYKDINLFLALFVLSRALIISYLFFYRDFAEKKDSLLFQFTAYASTFLPLTYMSGNSIIENEFAQSVVRLLILISYCWSLYALMSLGKSFGISPSRRSRVVSGPYSITRHPAYLGYFISELLIVLLNFKTENVLIFTLSSTLYLIRAKREDLILNK